MLLIVVNAITGFENLFDIVWTMTESLQVLSITNVNYSLSICMNIYFFLATTTTSSSSEINFVYFLKNSLL